MPNYNTTPHTSVIEEDEIDLRELFATIGRYKGFIFVLTMMITMIVAAIAYRMPKYYKSSTVIEVKPKAGDQTGFSLGGASALLGLAGVSGSGSSADKDAALLAMYSTNEKVLKQVNYSAQFYHYEKYRYTEIPDKNCSIAISDLKIPDYKKYGMEIQLKPTSSNQFTLTVPGKISDELLGEFAYDTPIHTEYFDLLISHKSKGVMPDKIILNADPHYIYNSMVSKNLSASVDKKNPFITISYLDTLPKRGERYVEKLIQHYIEMSIGFELEDIQTTLDSLNQQIQAIETKVRSGAKKLTQYKIDKQIVSPSTQADVLLKGQALTQEQLLKARYQLDLLQELIRFIKTNKNIDAIAPSLIELQDKPTIELITKLQSLQLSATSLAQEFKPAYPKLKSIRSQIRSIKSKIRSNLHNLQKTYNSKIKTLQKLLSEYDQKLASVPQTEKEMKEYMTDYTLNEKLYAYLLQKRAATELKKAEAMSRFRTIEPIYTNPAPAKPKKALIVIVGFITALILSIFLAFFREFLKKES